MNPSIASLSQLQTAPATHCIKRGSKNGLLSRLFGSLPRGLGAESSIGTPKLSTVISSSLQCLASLTQQAGTASTVSATSASIYEQSGINTAVSIPLLGYKTNIEETYSIGCEIGRGGNGVVRVIKYNETGEEFALKSIPKVLKDASDVKKQGHLER